MLFTGFTRIDKDILLRIDTTRDAVSGISFAGEVRGGSMTVPDIFYEAERQLSEYFSGKRFIFDLPLLLSGTPFQTRVRETLMKIPYGETISYAEEAELAGCERAVRAVANANGRNPVAIVIPCHRVIRGDGSLGGYFAGTAYKERLLSLEKHFVARENNI